MEELQLKIEKINNLAILPKRATAKSAGLDLSSANPVDIILEPGERKKIETGLKIEFPNGFRGRIAPRSGLADLAGIDILAGVIDEDYRGEIKVILINLGKEKFTISHGDRIAQLIIEKNIIANIIEVEKINEKSERGKCGFGSTGVKKVKMI